MFKKNDWNPKILEFVLNANFLERKELWRYIQKFSKNFNGYILDLGCGTKPYIDLFECKRYIGLELIWGGQNNADFFYDGNTFPFEDSSFDGLVSFQAIYQADNIENIMKEINRVLKINGKILISVPFIWFDGEKHSERKFSTHYTEKLFIDYGFEIIKREKTNPNLSSLFLLANVYFNDMIGKITFKFLRRILKLFVTPFLNLIGLLNLKFCQKTTNLYIDSVIYAIKVKNV